MSGGEASSPNGSPVESSPPTSETSPEPRIARLTGDYADPQLVVDDVPMLAANPMSDRQPMLFHDPASSSEGSPAKTSASPDAAPASRRASGRTSFSSSPESLTLFSQPEDGWSLRMFPDYSPRTVAEISPSFSRRWPSSGFTTSPGESWTVDTSECPSGGGAFSSLRDVLEDDVPRRYFLSRKAAAGILRRAAKRGRELPAHLDRALRTLSE
jgi:hypothetical protein